MSKMNFYILEELELVRNFLKSTFNKKYKNEWICFLVGLTLLFLYDHPNLIMCLLKL
jgi:hypothetical protein